MSKLVDKLVKHRKELMKEKIKPQKEHLAWKIIRLLKLHKELSGRQLADYLNTNTIDVRQSIQLIRERNHLFLELDNTKYIIATENGYQLTNDINKLKAYEKKLKITIQSKNKQLKEVEISLLKGDK